MRLRVTPEELLRWNLRGRHGTACRLHDDILLGAFRDLGNALETRVAAQPADGSLFANRQEAASLLRRLERRVVIPTWLDRMATATATHAARLRQVVLDLEALLATPGGGPLAEAIEACFAAASAARADALVAELVDAYLTLETVSAAFLPRSRAWALGRTARLLSSPPRARLVAQLMPSRPAAASPGRAIGVQPALRAEATTGDGPPADWIVRQLSWSSARSLLRSAAVQVPLSGKGSGRQSAAMARRRLRRRVARAQSLLELLHAWSLHLPPLAYWEHRAVRALQAAARRHGLPVRTVGWSELRGAAG